MKPGGFKAKHYLKEKYGDKVNCCCIMYNNAVEIISGKASKLKAIDKMISMEKLDDYEVYKIVDGYSNIEW